ncbi:hypothetical protein ACLOJK_037288 [Asimina triloba]
MAAWPTQRAMILDLESSRSHPSTPAVIDDSMQFQNPSDTNMTIATKNPFMASPPRRSSEAGMDGRSSPVLAVRRRIGQP